MAKSRKKSIVLNFLLFFFIIVIASSVLWFVFLSPAAPYLEKNTPAALSGCNQGVNPLEVNKIEDDNSCGTLRYALDYLNPVNNPPNGTSKIITIVLPAGSTISITQGTLVVPNGVIINGVCDNNLPAINLISNGSAGHGLVLGGNNSLNCLKVGGFSGNQIRSETSGTNNTVDHIRISNSVAATSITTNQGSTQSAPVGSTFAINLSALVRNGLGNPVNGVTVTFTAPATGASGTFNGNLNTITATTNASGIATASTFTANLIAGSYQISANFSGSSVPALFSLTNTAISSNTIIIDHNTIDSGDTKIPAQYLLLARNLDVLFNHQSVGGNIIEGLDRLAQLNPSKYSIVRASAPPTSWYSSYNGLGDFTAGVNEDPASKVNGFRSLIDSEGYAAAVKVAMMKFCYVDITLPAAQTWAMYRDNMLYLEAKYPNVTFVWWTMPITNGGFYLRDEYNQLVRNYVRANNKILFDIADIESHDPSGNQIVSEGYQAMYDSYTDDGGHLNATGQQRVARAWWWLMARIAGWNGQ